MRIVIAGISGFLGSRLKSFFKKKKYKVFDYKKKLPKNIDVLINVAGPDSSYCNKYKKKSILERLKINKKVYKIIKENNVKKYFYISTIHVYKKNKLIDENSKLDLENSYAKSHIISEKYILENFDNICDYKILRLSNCFGYCKNLKSSSWELAINNIVKNIFLKNKIIINSSTNFYRDFIPINYFFFILENLIKKSNKEKIFNISSQNSKSIYQITQIIQKLFKMIYSRELKIEKKFIKHDKKITIKSKLLNKINLKKFYIKDLKELIFYCKKNLANEKTISKHNNELL